MSDLSCTIIHVSEHSGVWTLTFGIQGFTTWSKAVEKASCSIPEKCMENTVCMYDMFIGNNTGKYNTEKAIFNELGLHI